MERSSSHLMVFENKFVHIPSQKQERAGHRNSPEKLQNGESRDRGGRIENRSARFSLGPPPKRKDEKYTVPVCVFPIYGLTEKDTRELLQVIREESDEVNDSKLNKTDRLSMQVDNEKETPKETVRTFSLFSSKGAEWNLYLHQKPTTQF
ncbi:hypothetical protein NPIL_526291 [Nephila pilipes]|uniref:Uncharacterized protein n=1 Tax=Nephila pilipes TaxID=299642 RepID=A0A8X6Q0A9_NEPPI|nr:hypothetical protein NPIL_526291 [Nephila pilipes]